MSAKARNRNSFEPAQAQATIANDPGSPRPANMKRLGVVRRKIMTLEFLAVAGSAYLASIIYHSAFIAPSPPVMQYVFAAFFIATLFSLVSAGFQHFNAIQMRPLHVLLWTGVGAVGLAFSIMLSTLFLLKIAEDYSRGTFIFQVVCVSVSYTHLDVYKRQLNRWLGCRLLGPKRTFRLPYSLPHTSGRYGVVARSTNCQIRSQ